MYQGIQLASHVSATNCGDDRFGYHEKILVEHLLVGQKFVTTLLIGLSSCLRFVALKTQLLN